MGLRPCQVLLGCLMVANLAIVKASCHSNVCYNTFLKISDDHKISPSEVLEEVSVAEYVDCIRLCNENPLCKSMSFAYDPKADYNCKLSPNLDPGLDSAVNSSVFQVQTRPDTTTSPTTLEDTTTVVDEPTTLTPCTNPAITTNHYDCSGTPTFEATAILKIYASEALIITASKQYYMCSSPNQISAQCAQQCNGPHNVVGDQAFDPTGTVFASNGPQAGVEAFGGNEADTRYYLFEGDTVYCYEHYAHYQARMRPCTSDGWTENTIQAFFGAGIPSDVDDVMADGSTYGKYYFLKDNLVYISEGGAMHVASPQPIHDVFPNMVCDLTAASLGPGIGDRMYAVQKRLYLDQGLGLVDRNELCNLP